MEAIHETITDCEEEEEGVDEYITTTHCRNACALPSTLRMNPVQIQEAQPERVYELTINYEHETPFTCTTPSAWVGLPLLLLGVVVVVLGGR